jgi:hypothetical protein
MSDENEKVIRSAPHMARADEEPIIYEVDDPDLDTHLQVHHVKANDGIALAIYEGEALEGASLTLSSEDAKELVDAILIAINGPGGQGDDN